MFRARAALPARVDLAAVADVPADATDVLVIDLLDLIDTEGANLPSRSTKPGRPAVATA
jgi:hypothetical protein